MYPSLPDHLPISDFAYKHRYIILVMVIFDSIMANLDSSMVNIVLLTMTSLFIICEKISEFVGVCRLFISGSIVFTLSSLACGFAGDLNHLIFFRVFPSDEIGRALGYSGSLFSVCAMCGPVLGITLASLLITLELNTAGYFGPILSADIGLLSRSVGWAIVLTGGLCAIGALASIIRNRDLVSENGYEHGT